MKPPRRAPFWLHLLGEQKVEKQLAEQGGEAGGHRRFEAFIVLVLLIDQKDPKVARSRPAVFGPPPGAFGTRRALWAAAQTAERAHPPSARAGRMRV